MRAVLARAARGVPLLLAVLLAMAVLTVTPTPVSADSLAGSAGTNVSLPATDSAVTASGTGSFSSLKVTVNQTKDLLNQAVSVTWTGGSPTLQGPSRFAGNYLQIMQCWGDADGTRPDDPGPPPSQCEFGARNAKYGDPLGSVFPQASQTTERIISEKNWPDFDPSAGFVEDQTGYVWQPFKPVNGPVVNAHINASFDPSVEGGQYWLNPFFDISTTNEIAAAPTSGNGTGATLFQVDTGIESTGLGCGQKVQPVAGGGTKVPQCWLVIVPRGTPTQENAGTPFGGSNANTWGVQTSPLAPAQWQNRIAIPLTFTPVDSPCDIAAKATRIAGSELATPAVSSWQPKLCSQPGAPTYSYSTISDASARQQVAQSSPGAPGMVVVSQPIGQDQLDPSSPVVYAPLTVSGTVVAFNIERQPTLNAPKDEQALNGLPVAHLHLTPRLLAKLLTQSYAQQVDIEGATPYPWAKANPPQMGADPDFLQFNPEFQQLSVGFGKNFGGLLMPVTNSDVAYQLWSYVLADPEAKAWLAGAADPWGMTVNPQYLTDASKNPSGVAFGDPTPSAFPKSDPFCYQGPPTGTTGKVIPPTVCGGDWLPYTTSLRDSAQRTQAGDDQSKVIADPFAQVASSVWGRDVPQPLGSRSILSVTDSASAERYGLQTASLSRAGDDGAGRAFVAADANGFTAGVAAMKAKGEQQVLEPDPLATTAGAYPLTMIGYGAIKPLALDATARDQYASFVQYAAGPGQTPGQVQGDLPPGYAPLPAALQKQATDAVATIRNLKAPAAPADTTPTSPAAETPSSSAITSVGLTTAASLPALDLLSASPPGVSVPVPTTPSSPVTASGILKRILTPVIATAASRFALPILGAVALLALLVAVEITKRPRRAAEGTDDA